MIPLTRLNKSGFMLNPDMIQTIEETPDTVLTLRNDEKLVVAETAAEVVDRIVAFRRRIFAALFTGGPDEVGDALIVKKETS